VASTNPLPAFSLRHALAWTAVTTLLLALAMSLFRWWAPTSDRNLLVAGALETVIYAGAAVALVGTRGRASERLRVLGLAQAPLWLLVAGAVLGVALHGPADFVAAAVTRLFPRFQAELLEAGRRLAPASAAERVAVFALAALFAPFVEELFFRGALFARLRLPGSRPSALVISAVCFVVCHLAPPLWPSLAIVAAALTVLRAVGRGIWPCILLHASFNATTVLVAFSRAPDAPVDPAPSLAFVVVGTVVSIVIVALVFRHVDMDRREFT